MLLLMLQRYKKYNLYKDILSVLLFLVIVLQSRAGFIGYLPVFYTISFYLLSKIHLKFIYVSNNVVYKKSFMLVLFQVNLYIWASNNYIFIINTIKEEIS